jgi:hypothetical protein
VLRQERSRLAAQPLELDGLRAHGLKKPNTRLELRHVGHERLEVRFSSPARSAG